jgi:hypothetical protein
MLISTKTGKPLLTKTGINSEAFTSGLLTGPAPAPAKTPVLTTTPINTDLREPRGAYRPGTRKTKNYAEEEPQAMKKGGLVKKKTITKKKK